MFTLILTACLALLISIQSHRAFQRTNSVPRMNALAPVVVASTTTAGVAVAAAWFTLLVLGWR